MNFPPQCPTCGEIHWSVAEALMYHDEDGLKPTGSWKRRWWLYLISMVALSLLVLLAWKRLKHRWYR